MHSQKVSCDSYQDELTGYRKLIDKCWNLEAIDLVQELRYLEKGIFVDSKQGITFDKAVDGNHLDSMAGNHSAQYLLMDS